MSDWAMSGRGHKTQTDANSLKTKDQNEPKLRQTNVCLDSLVEIEKNQTMVMLAASAGTALSHGKR